MTYIHDRQQYVRIGSEMFGMRESTHGVPQGPILGPTSCVHQRFASQITAPLNPT